MVATVSTVLPEFDLRPSLDELILASCLSRAQDGACVEYESIRQGIKVATFCPGQQPVYNQQRPGMGGGMGGGRMGGMGGMGMPLALGAGGGLLGGLLIGDAIGGNDGGHHFSLNLQSSWSS